MRRLPADRTAVAGGHQAEARLRSLGRDCQCQGRHQGRRQDLQVEIVYVDYASNTPRAVQSAERLITEDKVNFLFAPFGSGATKAASAISEKYGIPMIAPTASSARGVRSGLQVLCSAPSRRTRPCPIPIAKIVTAQEQGHQARRHPGAQRSVSAGDRAGVREVGEGPQGLEVVTFERYAIGTMDHSAAITQMRAAQPDWVYATGYINDLILIRKQMNDLGLKPPVITMIAGPAYQEFAEAAGPLAENISSVVLVASGGPLQGQGRVRLDRGLQRGLGRRSTAARPITSRRRLGGRRRDPAAGDRGRRFDRPDKGARRARSDGHRDLLWQGQVRPDRADHLARSRRCSSSSGGKPVVIWPDAIKQGDSASLPK